MKCGMEAGRITDTRRESGSDSQLSSEGYLPEGLLDGDIIAQRIMTRGVGEDVSTEAIEVGRDLGVAVGAVGMAIGVFVLLPARVALILNPALLKGAHGGKDYREPLRRAGQERIDGIGGGGGVDVVALCASLSGRVDAPPNWMAGSLPFAGRCE